MISEIGGVSAYDDQYLERVFNAAENHVGHNLNEQIFRDDCNVTTLSKNVTLCTILNKIEEKTKKAVLVSSTGFGVEGKVTVEWGGSEGVSVSGSASGNVSDDKGNKAEVDVTVNSDGSGSASVSVSHDENSDSEDK